MLFSALPSFAQSVVTSLGSANALNGPTFLALDTRTIGGVNATWLYVSEHGEINNTGGGRILRYNLTSGSTTGTVVATSGTGANQFTSPDTIIVDSATGDLFIADRAQNVVKRITNTGAAVSTFGTGVLRGPTGMVRDGSGNFYIAEHGDTLSSPAGAGGGFVSKWTAAGALDTTFGGGDGRIGGQGAGDGQFAVTGPYGIALTGSTLLVSDSFSSRIQAFNAGTGAYQSQFSIPDTLPLGLHIDSAGALWVSESSGNGSGPIQQVQRMPVAGGAATMTLTGGLSLPFHTVVNTGVTRAYVADYGNDRVVVFDLTTTSGGSVPAISSSATASGTVGQNFSYQITASNSPTSYGVVSGDSLPAGLTLNTTTGAITGIPSAAGTTTTRLTATNATGTSDAFTLTTTVAPATTTGTPAADIGPAITFFDLVSGPAIRVTFNTAVTGVDATDFAVNSQGAANAVITGVTADAGNPNSYLISFTFANADGWVQFGIKTSGTGITDASSNAFRGAGITASRIYGSGPTNGSTILPNVTATATAGTPSGNNVNFTVTFSAPVTGVNASDFIISGTSATIGTVTGSGTTYTVPVTASGNGTVTLTPIGGATADITDAADNWFAGAAAASATIGGTAGPVPTINSAATATGTVGTAFSYTITATNSPTSFSATGLPAGLTLNTTTGVISGTPTGAGTTSATLRASNANGQSAPFTLTLTVNGTTPGPVPTINSAATATGTVGTALSYQITATNSPTSYSASGLPAGLSLNTTTGVISGTPTAAGTTSATLTASNANGQSAAFTLTLTVTGTTPGPVPTVNSSATAAGTVGSPFSYQITATNSPTSYSATGLPAGLTLNTSTGVISGTPTAAATTSVTVRAANANGQSAPFTLTVTVAPMAVAAPSVSNASVSGMVGVAITPVQVNATNSPTSFSAAGLTAYGLSISNAGVISGTPTATANNAVVVVTATNGGGSGTGNITLNISAAVGAPVVSNASMSLTVGIPMVYTVQATNNPTSFTMSGAPSGLSISDTGIITGTPFGSGNYTITVTATNAAGSGTGTINLKLVDAGNGGNGKKSQTMTFTGPASLVFVGSPIRLQALVDSGLPITYTVVSGNATIVGDTVVVHNKGTVVIRASQAGDSTWNSASAEARFDADKRKSEPKVNLPQKLHTDKGAALPTSTEEGLAITYTVIDGPAMVQDGKVVFTGSGKVKIRATVEGNSVYDGVTQMVEVEGTPVPRLTNISSRLKVSANDGQGSTIAGFVVTGDQPKQILIRAVGPTLAAHGVGSPLADPTLKLYNSASALIATNSGWNNDADIAAATAQAFGFPLNANSKDAAILMTLQPGAYTAQVQSMNNSGTVLIEVYDVTAGAAVPTKQLVNISTRGHVGAADGDGIITGFVVSGAEPKKLLIRAAGPALTAYQVAGVVNDPVVKLYNSKQEIIASNDNWGTPQQVGSETPATAAEITLVSSASGAFPFAEGSADAAMVVTLGAGSYTAIVTGANGTTGAALVEVYEIPNP